MEGATLKKEVAQKTMKTLYVRVVVTTLLVMMISGIFSFIAANVYYQLQLKRENDKKVAEVALHIAQFVQQHPEISRDDYFSHIGNLGYQICLVNDKKERTCYGGSFRSTEINEDDVESVLRGNVYHGIAHFPIGLFVTGFFDNELRNTIGVPITIAGEKIALFIRPNVEWQFWEMRIFFALLHLFVIVLSVVFVLLNTRHLVKPLEQLTKATKMIAKGHYHIQLQVKRDDEIGQLAKHFSQMASELSNIENMRQQFVSHVSHEIQSPLTSIQGFAKALQNEKLSEEQKTYYLSIIEEESKRLSLLSKQLLTLAFLDREGDKIKKERIDLAVQWKQVIMSTEWQWRDKELALDLELLPVLVKGDKNLLQQVWLNLFINSIKFTETGGTISVRIKETDEYGIVEIEDTGIGIAEEDIPYIFNRFYKVDKARTRKKEGSGLGLSIVKKIIDLHDGQIEVKSKLGEGTTFVVRLRKM